MSNVRIHKPIPGLHSWGIEYNYEPKKRTSPAEDASAFVQAVNQLRNEFPGIWFHQSGATIESYETGYRGYQLFEYWGVNAEEDAKKMAGKVAALLSCQVVY